MVAYPVHPIHLSTLPEQAQSTVNVLKEAFAAGPAHYLGTAALSDGGRDLDRAERAARIQRPALVRPLRQRQRRLRAQGALASTAPAHLHFSFGVEPPQLLLVMAGPSLGNSRCSRQASETSSPPRLAFQMKKVASLTPCRRHTSAVFCPASCSYSMPMICSSLNRLRLMCPSLLDDGFYLSLEEFFERKSDQQLTQQHAGSCPRTGLAAS